MFLDDVDEEDYEIAIKVVIVGNGAVGKSSMIQRYCKGLFTTNYKKTIGVDFLEKRITACGEDVRLMLWDTAGQEEFDAITKAYYRGAQVCVIAFSTTDRGSFEAVKKWRRKVEDECGRIPMVLVQNKIDLLHESHVDSHEIEKFARNTGLQLYRTSVKENLNVSKVFQHLAERHIESVSRWSDDDNNNNNNSRENVRVRFSSSTEKLSSSDDERLRIPSRSFFVGNDKKYNKKCRIQPRENGFCLYRQQANFFEPKRGVIVLNRGNNKMWKAKNSAYILTTANNGPVQKRNGCRVI